MNAFQNYMFNFSMASMSRKGVGSTLQVLGVCAFAFGMGADFGECWAAVKDILFTLAPVFIAVLALYALTAYSYIRSGETQLFKLAAVITGTVHAGLIVAGFAMMASALGWGFIGWTVVGGVVGIFMSAVFINATEPRVRAHHSL